NPFKLHPSYKAIEHLPLAERVAQLRRPEVRARILAEEPDPHHPDPIQRFLVLRSLEGYPFAAEPDYEPDPESSLKAIAQRKGCSVYEAAYDALLERDGRAVIFLPINNFPGGSLDAIGELFASRDGVIALGDGGAHCGLICDANYPTFVLTYWTRDRRKGSGPLLTL